MNAPLFALRRTKNGPIKGRYAAPRKWQESSADANNSVLASLAEGDGLGMVCGHGVDVIDVDPRNGGNESLERMVAEDLIPLVHRVVGTPSGGLHLYIDSLHVAKGTPLPGIDVQARGSFVLLPPTEGYYDVDPADWPDLGEQAPDAAARLASSMAKTPREGTNAVEPTRAAQVTDRHRERAAQVLDKAVREVSESVAGRNNTTSKWLFLLYGFAKAGALDRDDVDEPLWEASQEAPGDHPYTRAEFDASRESAWQAARAELPRAESTPQDDFDPIEGENNEDAPLAWFHELDITALLDPNRPPRDWVVEGFLLAGAAYAFVAPAGHRKSLVALSISIALACGESDWAGMRIPSARRVVYIDMENTEDDLAVRLPLFGVRGNTPNFTFGQMPQMPPLDTAKGATKFAKALDHFGLERGDVVVLDSFQRVTGSPENDSDTARAYYEHTGKMLKRRGLTVIRLDNTGKHFSRGARGSSSKKDDVDGEYIFRTEGNYTDVTVTKSRQGGVSGMRLTLEVENGRGRFVRDAVSGFERDVDACKQDLDARGAALDMGMDKAAALLRDDDGKPLYSRPVIRAAVASRKAVTEDFS